MNDSLYPLKFKPILKDKIWGGDNFKKYLNIDIGDSTNVGESWEISDHFEDTSIILSINGLCRSNLL